MEICCGLLTYQKESVPLKSIEVEVEVRDHVATVVSTLNYENKEDKPIEALFVFPLPGDAAVCHFSAKIGQKEIVAEVKEKQEAREEYDDALSSGQQAFLLEESEQSPDIFSLSVGSLPPGESASIRLEYITELAVQADDGLRFCLPAVLNPRYQPQDSEGASVQVICVPASLVPYSLSFSARVSSPRPVSKVESNCSLDPLRYLNTEQTQATVKLAAGHKFDRDVELLIYYKDAHQPTAVVEAGQASAKPGTLMGDPVVMLSLYPEFPQAVMSSVASCGEFVLLLDRSGSMQGECMKSAKDTLLLLLKSLPIGCYFNIYSFGSSHEHIFSKSVEYSQKTLEKALKNVEVMDADLGGTEILRPLEHIYSQPTIPNQPRQLFVFTDGEVGNTKEVISLVKKNSGSHRCFSFGIGEGASSALINGLAKEGGGHAQFITGEERMQPKVMQSLRFALQPAVVDVSVKWDVPEGVSVGALSPPITTLFQGQRSLIYAQLTGQSSEAAEGSVTVKYSLAGHPCQNQLHFSLTPADDTGLTVHRLAAWTLIRSLEVEEEKEGGEHNEDVKKTVVELSVQSGVSSAFTAFVAVNKGNGEAIQGPMAIVNVPVSTTRFLPSYVCAPNDPVLLSAEFATRCVSYKLCALDDPVPYFTESATRCVSYKLCALDDPVPYSTESAYRYVSYGLFDPSDSVPWSTKFDSAITKVQSVFSRISSSFKRGKKASSQTNAPCGVAGTFLQLVSLQKASGCWELDPDLAAVLGKTTDEVEKSEPASENKEVWATILALIWLHGFKMDAKDEWELLAMKAVSWLRAQNAPCVTKCVEAGNTLLGVNVQKDALGL